MVKKKTIAMAMEIGHMVCVVGLAHRKVSKMKCTASVKSKFINLNEFECNSFVLKAFLRSQEMPDHSSRIIPCLQYEFHDGEVYEVNIDTAKTLIQPYRHCLETSISDNTIVKISPSDEHFEEAKVITQTLNMKWLKSDRIAVKWISGEHIKVESVLASKQYFELSFSLKKKDGQWLSSIFASTFDNASRTHSDKAFEIRDHEQYAPDFEFRIHAEMIDV